MDGTPATAPADQTEILAARLNATLAAHFPAFGLRPFRGHDLPFLCQLYASTRETELAGTGWTEAEKKAFFEQQFQLQHNYYRQHFTTAEFQVLLKDGEPVGRLYWCWEPDRLRLIDIALLPEHRGSGLGTCLMRCLQQAASDTHSHILLHVESFNPARHLYLRLGFQVIGDNDVYQQMAWSAPPHAIPRLI